MELRTLPTQADFIQAGVHLITGEIAGEDGGKRGVMLPGGNTPFPIYERLREQPPAVDAGVHFLLSDERLVPVKAPESNYGRIQPMFEALGVPEERVMRVWPDLTPPAATAAYENVIRDFIGEGGRLSLGLLGLGTDGHTASLFTVEQARSEEKYAVCVSRDEGPDRISVTRSLISQFDRIVFLVAGEEKLPVVEQLHTEPLTLPAGVAVEGVEQAEIWYCPEGFPPGGGKR